MSTARPAHRSNRPANPGQRWRIDRQTPLIGDNKTVDPIQPEYVALPGGAIRRVYSIDQADGTVALGDYQAWLASSAALTPRAHFIPRADLIPRAEQPPLPAGGPIRLALAPRQSRRALPADQLAAPAVGKLAPVMHKEAARAGELIRLPRDHPERELLV